MNAQALFHQPKSQYCFAYDKETVIIRFRAAIHDLTHIDLIYGDKYQWHLEHHTLAMTKERSDGDYDYFSAAIHTPVINHRLSYYFKLRDGQETRYFTEWGLEVEIDPNELHLHFFNFPYVNEVDIHAIPEWVKDAVFYQIFPERFENGDKANDPQAVVDWDQEPTRENFFGGDLQGIINRLDHIEKMGVNAIYMTPVFESTTNHKYDTIDYFKIDPHFGTNETFKELVDACHARGIRVVLDAVFNHIGWKSPQFQDVVEKGQASPYWDWFYIKDWPIEESPLTYQTFGFEPKMPKLNTAHPEVTDYLLEVASYWIKETGIDGWRLDVANEIDHEFWRKFRRVVKGLNPDAYIVGEIWHDAQPWLMGDQFDGSMNYPFTRACLQYFAWGKIGPDHFKELINKNIMRYTKQANESMLNILDSHDTARFVTEAGGDFRKLKLAALFQMTYEGAPSIYYGSEIGLEGKNDPECRRTMVWDDSKWQEGLYDFYGRIINLRHSFKALRLGVLTFVDPRTDAGDVLMYKKTLGEETITIVMNNTEHEANLSLDASLYTKDLYNQCDLNKVGDQIELALAPYGFAILK